jgi:hypothetical protein
LPLVVSVVLELVVSGVVVEPVLGVLEVLGVLVDMPELVEVSVDDGVVVVDAGAVALLLVLSLLVLLRPAVLCFAHPPKQNAAARSALAIDTLAYFTFMMVSRWSPEDGWL